MRLQNYLINEKLIDINEIDINRLTKPLEKWINMYFDAFETTKGFDKFAEKINSLRLIDISSEKIKYISSTSGKDMMKMVTSDSIKQAYEELPLNSMTYGFSIGTPPFYDADPRQNHILMLIDVYPLANEKFTYWDSDITDDERRKLKYMAYRNNSLNELRINMRHELTHWIDNALHGHYISKITTKTKGLQAAGKTKKAWKVFTKGTGEPYLTSREMNAIINSVQTIRNRFKDTWDDFGLKNLFRKIAIEDLLDEYGESFAKPFFKRMAKEGLLSKKMSIDLKKMSFRNKNWRNMI